MMLFFRLWVGHILLGVCIVTSLVTILLIRNCMAATDYREMFWLFVSAALAGLLSIVIGAIAAWYWRNPYERRYLRSVWQSAGRTQTGVPSPTRAWVDPVYVAHSPSEGDSSDGE